ncbi:MAG: phosphatase PAP2 family protein [Coxiellaceae bacterium]|nr:phosphatase PAP2 family protein [Coxiellaceae bacterium]
MKLRIDIKGYLAILFFVEVFFIWLTNHLFFHYQGIAVMNNSNQRFVIIAPAVALLYGVAWYIRDDAPKISFFFCSIARIFFVVFFVRLLGSVIQYTPFPRVDNAALIFDQFFSFNTATVFKWSQSQPMIFEWSRLIYNSLAYQLVITPVLLALLGERRSLDIFFIAALFSCLIGFSLYYFFPTTDPAAVFTHANFLTMEYDVLTQFREIHTHQPLTVHTGAIIGFPSFHVISAILVTYLLKNRKIIFIPVCVLNLCVIASTLTLGWHFLADIVGGIIIATISLWFASRTTQVTAVETHSTPYHTSDSSPQMLGK